MPYFNPDLDRELDDPALPPAVRILRGAIASVDALLIEKPVALINTAPHATHAIAALSETLRTMSTNLVGAACAIIAVPRNSTDALLLEHKELTTSMRRAMEQLALAARPDGASPELRAHGIHRA